jgi:cytochrome c55X
MRHCPAADRCLLAPALRGAAGATAPDAASASRQLVRMVRQDCGSCHGMQLTGGLGPPLTREALADRSIVDRRAVIAPRPPRHADAGWKSMLSEDRRAVDRRSSLRPVFRKSPGACDDPLPLAALSLLAGRRLAGAGCAAPARLPRGRHRRPRRHHRRAERHARRRRHQPPRALGRSTGWAICRMHRSSSARRRDAYVFGRDGALTKVNLLTRSASRARAAGRQQHRRRDLAGRHAGRGAELHARRRQGVRRRDARAGRRHPGDIRRGGAPGKLSRVVGWPTCRAALRFSLFDADQIWIADLSHPARRNSRSSTASAASPTTRSSRPTAATTSPACSARTAWR